VIPIQWELTLTASKRLFFMLYGERPKRPSKLAQSHVVPGDLL